MSNSNFVGLDVKIKQLREVVKSLDTNTLATYCFLQIYNFGTLGKRVKLNSPARQALYLFGIACSTAEPSVTVDNPEGKFMQIENLLNDIFGKCINVYLPTKDDLRKGLDDDWRKVREVAMPVFMGYFFEGNKIATADYFDIIKNSFDGFGDDIKKHFGIDHMQMLKITELISDQIQAKFVRIREISDVMKFEYEEFKRINPEDIDEYKLSLQKRNSHLMDECQELMRASTSFNFDSIKITLGEETVSHFLRFFVSERGMLSEIKYISDDNPFTYKPVITCNHEDYFLPTLNFLYEAIILNLERFFKKSSKAEQFRKSRDNRLEQETNLAFKNFFPNTSLLFESVFENDKSQHEHDLVIINDRTIIIVEAKASPRREPMRDPSKAYQRIRDDFRKKSGIQSASNQASKLRKLILENNETPLFDKKGNLIHIIEKSSYDNIYCVCITKDNFGMLATDLTLMLEKDSDDPYPWVICITDLTFLLTCLSDLGLTHEYFLEYISERIGINGKAIGNDELEFAGAYLNYGGFDFIKKENKAKVFLDISESRVFDEIHLEKINGRVYVHETKIPTYSELDRSKLMNAVNRHKFKKDDKKYKLREQRKSRRKNR